MTVSLLFILSPISSPRFGVLITFFKTTTMLGERTAMETISKMKLTPMRTRNKNETNEALSTPKYVASPSLNMVNANNEKMPVLIIGIIKEQTIIPGISAFPFNNLNNHPETKPAKPVFKTQHRIVPHKFIPKNNPLPGKTHTPLMTPNSNPAHGPYKIAPIAMGINARFILTPAMDT